MNISRIVLALLLIVGAGGALAGGTSAFFSDTETSTGNMFTAGDIDLKIDNESYYNGNKCTEVTPGIFQWQGPTAFPVPGTSCDTSFALSNLDQGKLFFNFTDIKPDDEGEDTISIHPGSNNAYACMDVTLTSNDDNSSVDPELADGDTPEDINNTWDGELAQNLRMFWWADDGDNVLEIGEQSISGGVKTLLDLASTTGAYSVALADTSTNVWTPTTPGPIAGNATVYIAKAWCFGNLSTAPVAQDGLGHTGTNGPQVRGTGVVCDGTTLNNLAQTDGATLDVAFRAIQSRNNPTFRCDGQERNVARLTVIKQIVNDNGGNNVVPDFQLFADNGVTQIGVTSGVQTTVLAGNYSITETGVQGYVASFSGDCDSNGDIILGAGDVKTCTITNNDLPANITLIKNVINNNGGGAGPTQFGLRVDGLLVQNNTSTSTSSNVAHTINETGRAGYTFVGPITGTSNYGQSCPATLGGSITLAEGEAITCTITNDDN